MMIILKRKLFRPRGLRRGPEADAAAGSGPDRLEFRGAEKDKVETMKKWLAIAGAALLLLAGCKHKAPQTTCTYGNDVPEATENEIMQAGSRVISQLEKHDYNPMYEAASSLLKQAQTRDQFSVILRVSDDKFGEKEFSQVEELYLMTSKTRDAQAVIPCNLGAKGIQDFHIVPSNAEVAALIYKSHGQNEWLRVVIHLIHVDKDWKLLSIAVNPSTAKGQPADFYFKAARESREKNRLHLAALQYRVAILLSELGPAVQEFTITQISSEMSQIKADYLPLGSIQVWTMPSGHSFNVANLGVFEAGSQLDIEVTYQAKSLADHAALDADGRELAQFLDQKFPEYREGFDGIAVTAVGSTPADAYKLYRVMVPFADLAKPAQP